MLNFFFRKVRLFLIILFLVFSSLSFITYLNYTGKLSSTDTHNSILNFFKPKYQHYILVNSSYLDKFLNLTKQIIVVYQKTPGLYESFKENIDLVKFNHQYAYNTFVFNENYYSYPLPGESEEYQLCKAHTKIIKKLFKENEKVFCNLLGEINTHNIVIVSNKKKINVEEINIFFINEYVNLYKRAFARVRQINPTIKKNAEIYLQIEKDSKLSAIFFNLTSEVELLKNNFLQINFEKNKLLNINNEKYQIIKFNELLKDYDSFCKSQLPMCPKIIQFYQRPNYNKIINNDSELNSLIQYVIDIDFLPNQILTKKIISDTTEFKMNLINERYKLINVLLNSDFNNFSRDAIQFQSVKIKNNHLILVCIILFAFSLMISFIIFFILSINELYRRKIN